MGKANRLRVAAIKAGTRMPFLEERGSPSAAEIMNQLTQEERLRGLGLLSVRPKYADRMKRRVKE